MAVHKRADRALKIAAIAQLVNAAEGMVGHRQFGRNALLAGRSATRTSIVPAPFRRALDTRRGALAVHGLALVGALGQLAGGPQRRKTHIAAAAASLASNKLFELRNPYGRDGADQMLGVLYSYRVATAVIPDPEISDDLFLRAVNAQATISYAAAGLAKAISAEWLSGNALELILKTNVYGSTPVARAIRERPGISRTLTWSTVIWESSYPLIYLLAPRQAKLALHGMKAFHIGIAYTMGLPRFFWAFSGAHEAISYVIEERGGVR
ncbi:hypothetical protein [Luteipulveratus flavus]|uniref:HTTM-like domain-containing protein n=1 Tax=Luteipulveratus flavus TaxID=3031728 RepID=A0ABT6C7C6_9MICO|nr:hypothetical protein [Luteipulveratus sp. YIM 133296]MDF8264758.1 hypothetical protein [Luteipulveratus sp. YIM 133296]